MLKLAPFCEQAEVGEEEEEDNKESIDLTTMPQVKRRAQKSNGAVSPSSVVSPQFRLSSFPRAFTTLSHLCPTRSRFGLQMSFKFLPAPEMSRLVEIKSSFLLGSFSPLRSEKGPRQTNEKAKNS